MILVQAKKVVGMTGLPVLCNVLKSDKADKEMLRGSLECLTQLVAPTQVEICCKKDHHPFTSTLQVPLGCTT